jgi:hypothetical protein
LLLQLDTINIDRWEEEEVPAALGEGIRPRELHPPYSKTSRGEYRLNNAKINRILTFPSSLQLLTIILIR